MKKSYFLLAIGIIQSLFSLGLFIESFESVADDWGGISNSGNMTYLVWFICAVLFSVYSYILVKEETEVKN